MVEAPTVARCDGVSIPIVTFDLAFLTPFYPHQAICLRQTVNPSERLLVTPHDFNPKRFQALPVPVPRVIPKPGLLAILVDWNTGLQPRLLYFSQRSFSD